MIKEMDILGMRVNLLQIPEVLRKVEEWIEHKKKTHYISVTNVNNIMISQRSKRFKEITNSADLSVPDGITLIWLARYFGNSPGQRVRGTDLMFEFCRLTSKKGYTNFLYGATNDILPKLMNRLEAGIPGLKIVGVYSPPFRPLKKEQSGKIIQMTNNLSPNAVWVSLG